MLDREGVGRSGSDRVEGFLDSCIENSQHRRSLDKKYLELANGDIKGTHPKLLESLFEEIADRLSSCQYLRYRPQFPFVLLPLAYNICLSRRVKIRCLSRGFRQTHRDRGATGHSNGPKYCRESGYQA
jgi:hypothetical protein